MTQYNLKVLVILKISSILGPLRSFKVFWAILFTLIVQGGGGGCNFGRFSDFRDIFVIIVVSGLFWSFLRF